MKILIYNGDAELIASVKRNAGRKIRQAEFKLCNEYNWEPDYHSVDGVIIISSVMPHCYDKKPGHYGLVVAAEAKERGIPVFMLVKEAWENILATKLGVTASLRRDDSHCGLDGNELSVWLYGLVS